MNNVTIVGAGMAGCEAALQLVAHGYNVTLFDSKPSEILPPYRLGTYAELVCNNSIGNLSVDTSSGLLLNELKLFGCKMLAIAEKCRVNDPAFLAVNKKMFSQMVTSELYKNKVKVINNHVYTIPNDDYVIIATGPVTDNLLMVELSERFGIDKYSFSDASSPIVDIRSIDIDSENVRMITNDLYAVLISQQDFQAFYEVLLVEGKQHNKHGIDKNIEYKKCKSIEQLAQKGIDELYLERFHYNYSDSPCLLLRRESGFNYGFILVGCITSMRHSAQLSAFKKISIFKNCKFIKYGRMHYNTYINSPQVLNEFYQIKGTQTFVIGQLSGIDGYAPAMASGLIASMRIIYGSNLRSIPSNTMIGALARYISNTKIIDFQPMCASFSLMNNYNKNTIDIITNYLIKLDNMK